MSNNKLMDNLKIDLNISPDLKNLMNRNNEIAPEATKLGLRAVTKEMSKQTKAKVRSLGLVNSGQLAKSIRGSTTKTKSFVGTKLWYAHFLEGGTEPHVIKPRRTKMLWWSGVRKPIKRVFHPGIRGYRFAEGTYEKMQNSGEIESLFSQGLRQAIEELSNG